MTVNCNWKFLALFNWESEVRKIHVSTPPPLKNIFVVTSLYLSDAMNPHSLFNIYNLHKIYSYLALLEASVTNFLLNDIECL